MGIEDPTSQTPLLETSSQSLSLGCRLVVFGILILMFIGYGVFKGLKALNRYEGILVPVVIITIFVIIAFATYSDIKFRRNE